MKKLTLYSTLLLVACTLFAFKYNSDQTTQHSSTSIQPESSEITEFSSAFFSKEDLLDLLKDYEANTVFFNPTTLNGKSNIHIDLEPINEGNNSTSETFQFQSKKLENPLMGNATYEEVKDEGLNAVAFESVFIKKEELERLLDAPGCKGINFYPITYDLGTRGTYTGVFKTLKAESVFEEGVVVPLTDGLNTYMIIGPGCPPFNKQGGLFH